MRLLFELDVAIDLVLGHVLVAWWIEIFFGMVSWLDC